MESSTEETEARLDVSNLSNRVYRHIKRMIMTGRLKGGERIPEQAIAEKLGVSRTPIREALRRLDEHGLVVIEPRRYTRVATVTLEDKRLVGQVRQELGLLAIRLLADRATPEDCKALTEIARRCSDLAEQGDTGPCFELDSELHSAIAERSGNPYLADLTRTIEYKVQLLRNIEDSSPERIRHMMAPHLDIVQALCLHDVERATRLMREHLAGYHSATDGSVEESGAGSRAASSRGPAPQADAHSR